MRKLLILLPHQLFKVEAVLNFDGEIILIEEDLFFNQFKFHKSKLVFHRASMKSFSEELKGINKSVHYINAKEHLSKIEKYLISLKEPVSITIFDPCDDWIKARILKACNASKHRTTILPSPLFLNTSGEIIQKLTQMNSNLKQADFYIKERKQRQVLLDNNKPLGGKWSFDSENRKKLPKNVTPPFVAFQEENNFTKEASEYVSKNYAQNWGKFNPNFLIPTTHEEAEKWLDNFLETRLFYFGHYEDAIDANHPILYHSLLSPLMNVGLLTPEFILEKTLAFVKENEVPLNSLEGFIRQIIGWREFIRGIYLTKGRIQRTCNFWKFEHKIPLCFYEGNTGIKPVDDAINKAINTGYNHHIERLMILGNFMFLCEIHPDEVYKWFMTMYLDAYDWVMVPNVYGMSQFADGGIFATKPYISGSNYILKMSNYKREEWCETWDALYWRFISKNRNFFKSQPRLSLMIGLWDKKEKKVQNKLLSDAEHFLTKIHC